MVEVKKLKTFYDFCGPRTTLCGDSRGSKTQGFLRFLRRATLCGDRARRGALAVAPRKFVAREMAFASCLDPAVAGSIPPGARQLRLEKSQLLSTNVVRGACSWKIATFKYRRSMRSVLPQLRLENRNF